MAQIELTESDNELPRKLAAILRKGTRHPDYFTLDGLKSEVWPVSRRLFDILEAAITERIPGIKLDRTEPRESPVKKGRQVLDSLSVTLTNMDPTLYLGVNIGMDDREEELSHRLTWGVSAWGEGERIKKIAEMVKSLGLKEDREKVRVFKSPLFGGANFFLGNDSSPDGLENQPLAQLIDQIVNDFDALFGRFKAREKEIRTKLGFKPNEPQDELSLSRFFAAQGLHFTPHQLATFYTALKTKGFVILTGVSGTGKTKLAQYFAELLSGKDQFHFAVVRPDWRDSKSLLGYFNPLLGKEGQFQSTEFLGFILEATEQYQGISGGQQEDLLAIVEKLIEFDSPPTRADLPEEARELVQRQPGIQKISRETFAEILDLAAVADRFDLSQVTQTFLLRLHEVSPYADEPGKQYHFRMGIPGSRQLSDPLSKGEKVAFVYYSPDRGLWAAGTFDRIEREPRASAHVPYFVLLDEMNLAKVEYYFADFLSVLESGRRGDGFTKEAIRFQYPEGIDGPPRELYLPPNLYFIGTVNVDETTYMFSPKVLDRAFTLELGTVNLEGYPGEHGEPLSDEVQEQLRAQLLPDFTRQGHFAVVDKTRVAEFAASHDACRQHLSTLNTLLQPHDLHFGYRVFDEIMMFLANAENSPVLGGFGPDGLDAAFDSAVLMKVLPKFHGTRGKLGEPLEKMVGWARKPGDPEEGRQIRSDQLRDAEERAKLREGLRKRIEGGTTGESSDADAFAYPRTALKALRMLHDLYTTGFASFA